jgi:hypothetical protein
MYSITDRVHTTYISHEAARNTPATMSAAREAEPMSSVSHITRAVINIMVATMIAAAKLSRGSNNCFFNSLSFAIAGRLLFLVAVATDLLCLLIYIVANLCS